MKWAGTPDWFYPYEEKRPDQIRHRLGKAWIFTAWNLKALASEGMEKITYFKTEERKYFDKDKTLPISDDYCVIEHKRLGEKYLFGEFQVTESGNKWNKDYYKLFQSFGVNEPLILTVVTTNNTQLLKTQLIHDLSYMKNVRVEYFTLDKLKEYCWRIALQMREDYRQKELITK